MDLVDFIKGQLGAGLVSKVATKLGESEASIFKAINGLIPAILGSLMNNSKDAQVLDFIMKSSKNGLLGNLIERGQSEEISTFVSRIFGDTRNLVNSVASFVGTENKKIQFLLNLVTGAIVGAIGKFVTDNQLDKVDIVSLLESYRDKVSTLIPEGISSESLGLGSFLGEENIKSSEVEKNFQGKAESIPHLAMENSTNNTEMIQKEKGVLWKWIVPLILLLYAGWYLFQPEKNHLENALEKESIDSLNIEKEEVIPNEDSLAIIPLQGETKLKGFVGGIEQRMIVFLQNGGYEDAINDDALKDNWYNFDKVKFVFGTSNEITPESYQQLENIANILKAFPEVKVKIGGYTDRKGEEAINQKISQNRADFIKQELTKMGVGEQIISAEGYGEKFAEIDENAPEEQREADRKMAIRFTK